MPSVATRQEHVVPLDPACPRSGNPKAGSTVKIAYTPQRWHLEVYSLRAVVDSYKGGLTYPEMSPGEYVVRDQEHMIQHLAQVCANAVGVEVETVAQLILSDGVSTSEMRVVCVAKPVEDSAVVSRFAVQS